MKKRPSAAKNGVVDPLRQRWRALFKALATRSEDGRRVHFDDIQSKWSAHAFADGSDYRSTLSAYLDKGAIPRPKSAWVLGEVLHKCNLPWMSGIWVLLVTGQLDEVIGILATWATFTGRPTTEMVNHLWAMLATAHDLVPLHRAGADVQRRASVTRSLWTLSKAEREALTEAADVWLTYRDTDTWTDLFKAAYACPTSHKFDLGQRERASLAVLARCFEELPSIDVAALNVREAVK